MKRLSAILLSLLLMWMQVVVMAQPAKADATAKCRRCSCKTGHCCVGQSNSSESLPQPAAPAPSAQLNLNLFSIAASPAWLLPLGAAAVFSSPTSSPLSTVGVPLFQRDCALLI